MWALRLVLAALAGRGLGAPSPAPSPSGAQCLDSRCFALFGAARSFAEAGAVCARAGGHLMTVRSTVAAEAIALLLLRSPSRRAWLGLRLPDGAAVEPAKALRGFQWVAGDERTDYSSWAEAGAAGGRGPTCVVVVSPALRWEERACDAADADAFLCEYSYAGGSCAPLELPPGAAASYVTPFGARDSELVALPPGTTAEVPELGASVECGARGNGALGWRAPAPGAWDCRLHRGGCDGQCLAGGRRHPLCTCPEGAALSEEDRRSCLSRCDALRCQHLCAPQGSSAACMCSEGYELAADQRSCEDKDDCQAEPSPCSQECVNTEGGFECRCFAGYELVQGRCVEQTEGCLDAPCEQDCIPGHGSYTCTCFQEYIPDPRNPHKCIRFCNETECTPKCDPNTGDGCECPPGYIMDEKPDGTNVCADINECDSSECGNLECINMPGGYRCLCPNGLPAPDPLLCEAAEEEFSGSTESDQGTSVPTLAPPKDSRSSGMLVAIIVSAVFLVVVLGVALCFLVKKHCAARTRMDYKCQSSESGVVLQPVSANCTSSTQKM